MSNERKQHETVIITGASAGVGRATALRFARTGTHLGLIARDTKSLNAVKREIEEAGGTAAVAAADVADAEAVFDAANKLEQALGPVDVWINDAMVTVFSPFSQMTPDEFRRVTEVTYLGFVHGTMAALRLMRPRNRGTVVQVGSALAYRAVPLQSAYCGAKHAIRGFTDSLRTELIHDGSDVHLTIVHLPAVNTPQFDWARTHMNKQPRPVPPVIQPEAAAEAIFRAAHSRRRETWLGLSSAEAILGNMLGPAFLDRYLARSAYRGQMTNRSTLSGRRDNLITPVSNLHRTRGKFDKEAAAGAVALPGQATRLTVAATGLVSAGLVGLLLSRLARR